MRITWSPEYELGIAVIDRQHQRIVELINTLDRLMDEPDAHLGVSRVLYDLVDYTESHFGFEEALMKEAGFDGLDEHHQAHENFVRQIGVMQRRHEAGEDVAGLLLALLERWLMQHILAEDAGYTARVNAWIDHVGREGLGAWVNDNLRRHFRHP